jgi:hypothetical protein
MRSATSFADSTEEIIYDARPDAEIWISFESGAI